MLWQQLTRRESCSLLLSFHHRSAPTHLPQTLVLISWCTQTENQQQRVDAHPCVAIMCACVGFFAAAYCLYVGAKFVKGCCMCCPLKATVPSKQMPQQSCRLIFLNSSDREEGCVMEEGLPEQQSFYSFFNENKNFLICHDGKRTKQINHYFSKMNCQWEREKGIELKGQFTPFSLSSNYTIWPCKRKWASTQGGEVDAHDRVRFKHQLASSCAELSLDFS